jgi:hypothetical protein
VPRGTLSLWRSHAAVEPVGGTSGAAERVVEAQRARGALLLI